MIWVPAFAFVITSCIVIISYFWTSSQIFSSIRPDSGPKAKHSEENSLMFFSFKQVCFLSLERITFGSDLLWSKNTIFHLLKERPEDRVKIKLRSTTRVYYCQYFRITKTLFSINPTSSHMHIMPNFSFTVAAEIFILCSLQSALLWLKPCLQSLWL